MTASDSPRSEQSHQSSVWGEFFAPCAPRCADQCCGDRDNETQTNEDDLVHVYAFDDEHVSFSAEEQYLPTMRQPVAATQQKKFQRDGSWAGSDSFGQVGRGFPSQASSMMSGTMSKVSSHGYRGVAVPTRPRRAPSPSVNPLSKFGFMTMTVSGSGYTPDFSDKIDVEMSKKLNLLDPEASGALLIRRLTPGKYEIDGRFVSVRWNADKVLELLAKEDIGDDEELPVAEYLEQLAGLAREIRPPVAPRALTFPDEAAEDRYESMQLACEQAKLREKAAEACWQHDSSGMQPATLLTAKPQVVTAVRTVSSVSSAGVMPSFLRRLH